MAISRYKKINIVKNNDADYKKVFNTRFGTNGLVQTTTTTFRTPTEDELLNVSYITATWSLGQRLYKLAYQYYGDASYWWLIALYNNISTEAELQFGQTIKVPVPLDTVLNLYGF
jgi:hypothetical protein